jgi:hypothetical protein
MKKTFYLLFAFLVGMIAITSCDSTESYAEQKSKEKAAIKQFIKDSSIVVISETKFNQQDYTTDTVKNEFVLFSKTGVYMQIVRQGCGSLLADGETATVLCRFSEWNILGDSMQLNNDILYYSSVPEKMSVKNSSGTFTASFDKESSLMYTYYSSTSVPSGWLIPLTYIKLGRQATADESIAKVRLIVPHSEGQSDASSNVYPCFYTITYEKGI